MMEEPVRKTSLGLMRRSLSLGSSVLEQSIDGCHTPCKHHPIAEKYPCGLVKDHTELKQFADDLAKGVSRLEFTRRDVFYNRVHALLINWENDDLQTKNEIEKLQTLFAQKYNFSTESYSIPSDDSHNELEAKLVSTRNAHGKTVTDLVILYYGGHGMLNKENQSIWKAWKTPPRGCRGKSPELNWSELQRRFETAKADVLFLIDCCYATNLMSTKMSGVKEMIAASGRRDKASGSQNNSFTNALINEFESVRARPIQVAVLHQRLLKNQERHGLEPTPIHAFLSEEVTSIVLARIPRKDEPVQYSPVPSSSDLDSDESDSEHSLCATSATSLQSLKLTSDCRILISVSLKPDSQTPIVEEWINWIWKHAPRDIGGVKVSLSDFCSLESAWKSNSSLLLVSLPVAVWNVLAPNPAYSFVAILRSENEVGRRLGPSLDIPSPQAHVHVQPTVPIQKSPRNRSLSKSSHVASQSSFESTFLSPAALDQFSTNERIHAERGILSEQLRPPITMVRSSGRLFFDNVAMIWWSRKSYVSLLLNWWTLYRPPILDRLDETYPAAANIKSIGLHVCLSLIQTSCITVLVFLLLWMPTPIFTAWAATFALVNSIMCDALFDKGHPCHSDALITVPNRYSQERWILISGFAALPHWTQLNVDRLALTFGRPVTGLSRSTRGFLFDFIMDMVQRNFGLSLAHTRNADKLIRSALEEGCERMVLILHGGGAIDGSIVLDGLVRALPAELLSRIEVYTFGNGANQFNYKHLGHIEHYVNCGDVIAQCGIIRYPKVSQSFAGRVFMSDSSSGHLLNQDYLKTMFPLAKNGELASDFSDFMEADISLQGGEKLADPGEWFSVDGRPLKNKVLSRLWQYRNGRSPSQQWEEVYKETAHTLCNNEGQELVELV